MTLSKAVFLNLVTMILFLTVALSMFLGSTSPWSLVAALVLAGAATLGIYSLRRPAVYRLTSGPKWHQYGAATLVFAIAVTNLFWPLSPRNHFRSYAFTALEFVVALACVTAPWLKKANQGGATMASLDHDTRGPKSTPGAVA